jgi:hypothetical protein
MGPALAHPDVLPGRNSAKSVRESAGNLARAAVGDVEFKETAAAAEGHQIMTPAMAGLGLRPVRYQQPSIGGCTNRVGGVQRLARDACPVSSVVGPAHNTQLSAVECDRETSARQDGKTSDPPIELCHCGRGVAIVAQDTGTVGDEE